MTLKDMEKIKKDSRGSAVAMCLCVLGLSMAIVLAFLLNSRRYTDLAAAQSHFIKASLIAESGLERALAAMEQRFTPMSKAGATGNADNIINSIDGNRQWNVRTRNDGSEVDLEMPWYTFSQQDLDELSNMVSGEIIPLTGGRSIDDETADYLTKDGSSISVKFIYHGGKLDPNWFGKKKDTFAGVESANFKGASIGFSPIGQSFTGDNKKLQIARKDLVPEEREILWFSRGQIQLKLHDSLSEREFSLGNYNNDIFFPFSPRDSTSSSDGRVGAGGVKNDPCLIVRTDGRKCISTEGNSYEGVFHRNFCEVYGGGNCVYFGGGNTFLDKALAKYDSEGNLINPETAVKRRMPFYCLKYLHRKGGKGSHYQDDNTTKFRLVNRNPDSVLFISSITAPVGTYENLPEYLRGQRLIDCVPWFRAMYKLPIYGRSGADASQVWRFWQLLSNFTRYCGPSGMPDHATAVTVYDSNSEGYYYSGRRAGAVPSKIRLRLVKGKVVEKVQTYDLQMQIETVNFHLQDKTLGNRERLWLQVGDVKHLVKLHDGERTMYLTGGHRTEYLPSSEDKDPKPQMEKEGYNPWVYTPGGTINPNWHILNLICRSEDVKANPAVFYSLSNKEVTINRIAFICRPTTSPRYGYWSPTIRLEFIEGIELEFDEENPTKWLCTLECKDPLASNSIDAWDVYLGDGVSGWGNPNKSWTEANGILSEGKVPNPNKTKTIAGYNQLPYLPEAAYVRGTFPQDGGLSDQNNQKYLESFSTFARHLGELGVLSKAIPGKTLDLIGADNGILEQFCLFPGDDEASYTLSKKIYIPNESGETLKHLSHIISESGKMNPNSLIKNNGQWNIDGASAIAKEIYVFSENTPAHIVYGEPEKADLRIGEYFTNLSLPVKRNGYSSRGQAVAAIANEMTGASQRQKEELAGKLAQLMQVRYQYFEVIVTSSVAKRISSRDVENGGLKVEGTTILSAVVERDAFTGKVRVLCKRERFYNLKN